VGSSPVTAHYIAYPSCRRGHTSLRHVSGVTQPPPQVPQLTHMPQLQSHFQLVFSTTVSPTQIFMCVSGTLYYLGIKGTSSPPPHCIKQSHIFFLSFTIIEKYYLCVSLNQVPLLMSSDCPQVLSYISNSLSAVTFSLGNCTRTWSFLVLL